MAVPSEFHPSEFHIIHLFRAARAYSRGIYASYMQPYKLNDLFFFFFFFFFLTLFFIFLVETLRRRNGDSIRNILLILSPFSLQFQGGCTHTHTHPAEPNESQKVPSHCTYVVVELVQSTIATRMRAGGFLENKESLS